MTSKIIPIIGAARLSQETDESTSIERQTAGIESWATFGSQTTNDDYRVIKVTEDSDVSGAVSPFDRVGLGPYLRRPLLDKWQVLVVFRLDRLTRSIADFEILWKFLEANGKTLVSVSEQIDFGTTAGRLMARQLVIFAEYEREMIRARIKNAYDAARAAGKYPGMQFPFGYFPVKLPDKGWGLEPHPEYGLITVPRIVQRLLAGESLVSICRSLDDEGIPTPRNAVREHKGRKPLEARAHWDTTSLVRILRSPTIIGESTIDGKTLRDNTGKAVKRAEPLIDRETWERVKAILEDNAARIGPKAHVSPLLRVAFCSQCGSALYSHSANPKKSGQKYRYYYCVSAMRKRGCAARRINADRLEAWTENKLLTTLGDLPIPEFNLIPAHDNSTAIAELAEACGALTSQIMLGRAYGHDVSDLEEQQRIHEANMTRLAAEPRIEERRIPRAASEKWGERWHRIDWNARNELMRKHGILVNARYIDGKPHAKVSGAEDILEYHDLAARGIHWSAEEAI